MNCSRSVSEYSPRFSTSTTTSTSFVCRGGLAAREVMKSSVTAPPRNTNRSLRGASRSTTHMIIARLSDTGSAIDEPRQMLLGQIPLAGAATAERVDQAQVLVQL